MPDSDALDHILELDSDSANIIDPFEVSTVSVSNQSSTSRTSSPPAITSGWAILKWIIWSIVSRIFNCGAPFLALPFALVWPNQFRESNVVEADNISSIDIQILHAASDQNIVSECIEDFHQTEKVTYCNESHPHDKAFCVVDTALENTFTDQVKVPNGKIKNDEECVLSQSEDSLLSIITTDENLFIPAIIEKNLLHNLTEFNHCTLFSSLCVDGNNGVNDFKSKQKIANALIESVLPRNLSTSSQLSIKPNIRKMYAWSNVKPLLEPDEDKPSGKCEFELSPSHSDEQIADPGRPGLLDTPSSPLSPSTLESTGISEGSSQNFNECKPFSLPDLSREDQTLAWTMSHLKTSSNNKKCDSAVAVDYSSPKIERRSRDKSPVLTANSAKIADYFSVPSFMPYDGFYSFDSEMDSEIPKPKRSSSLKSNRTPPGTPGQKVVRFADSFGLDLTTVHHVPNAEVPPKVPACAISDLNIDSDESIAKIGAKQFGLCFAQPGAASNFIRRVINQTVCLEDAYVDMPRGVLTGTIRVRSLGFEKRVIVRTTYNNWATFCDTPASYVQGSHDGATDRFSFSLVFPDTMIPGDRAQFAIRYESHTSEQFWDNNHGQNYIVTCYAKATDLVGDGSWVHYL